MHSFIMGIPLRDTNISICPTILLYIHIDNMEDKYTYTKERDGFVAISRRYHQTILCLLLLSGRQIQMEMPNAGRRAKTIDIIVAII